MRSVGYISLNKYLRLYLAKFVMTVSFHIRCTEENMDYKFLNDSPILNLIDKNNS